MRTLGIILIVLGVFAMIYTGFTYVTTKNVVDLGPIQIDKEQNHPVHWSPIVGVIFLIAGIIIVIKGKSGK